MCYGDLDDVKPHHLRKTILFSIFSWMSQVQHRHMLKGIRGSQYYKYVDYVEASVSNNNIVCILIMNVCFLTDKEEEMIECSGQRCRSGKWFHLGCVDIAKDDVPDGDWFCEECTLKMALYPYCVCYEDNGQPMIACDNPECEKEWFHLACVGVKEIPGMICHYFCSYKMVNPCSDYTFVCFYAM